MHVPTVTVADLPDPMPEGVSFLDVREPVGQGTTATSPAQPTSP